MVTYVQLTFKPAGAKHNLTCWAQQASPRSFWQLNRHGEQYDPKRLVIVGDNDYTAKPAVVSKKYGCLLLVGDPDLNNEIDNPAG